MYSRGVLACVRQVLLTLMLEGGQHGNGHCCCWVIYFEIPVAGSLHHTAVCVKGFHAKPSLQIWEFAEGRDSEAMDGVTQHCVVELPGF